MKELSEKLFSLSQLNKILYLESSHLRSLDSLINTNFSISSLKGLYLGKTAIVLYPFKYTNQFSGSMGKMQWGNWL